MSTSDVNPGGTTRHELREQASRVRDDIVELTRLARSAAREEFERLRDNAADNLGRGRRKANRLQEDLDRKVSERPLTSLAIAVGAGVILGSLLTRGNKG